MIVESFLAGGDKRRWREGALLLGLDFDGTLAPIAPRPDLARLSLRNRQLLERLARKSSVTVVVASGRGLRDVKSKVDVPGLFYAGNHGLEIEGPDGPWVHPQAKPLARTVRRLARDISQTLGRFPGLVLEDKGLTLSLHYRLLPKNIPAPAVYAILLRLMKPYSYRLHVTHGHKVWEVRPRLAWDKGYALLRILRPGRRRWTAALVGDDRTDEEGFRTLGPDALTVRVGRARSTAARFRLRHQDDVSPFLEFILREWE
jgi:trehalose 6-phosphate phosphatase